MMYGYGYGIAWVASIPSEVMTWTAGAFGRAHESRDPDRNLFYFFILYFLPLPPYTLSFFSF